MSLGAAQDSLRRGNFDMSLSEVLILTEHLITDLKKPKEQVTCIPRAEGSRQTGCSSWAPKTARLVWMECGGHQRVRSGSRGERGASQGLGRPQ